MDAGDGYVSGYRVETFGSKEFSVDAPSKKPEDTDSRDVSVRQYIGNYFRLMGITGIPSPNEVILLQNHDDENVAKAYYRYLKKIDVSNGDDILNFICITLRLLTGLHFRP